MRDYAELVKGGSRIQLYRCGGRLFQERRSRLSNPNPSGPLKNVPCADNDARDRMYDERLSELLADGWIDQSPRPAATRKKAKAEPDLGALERAFGELAKTTIAELAKADEKNDVKVWRRAIAAYGKLKVRAGGDRTENLVHFFAVDGIALDKRHPIVVTRARGSKSRKDKWLALLSAS